MSTEHETAAILRVLARMELPDDRGGPTVWADGTLTLPAGHYWGIAAEVVAAVQGGRYWDTAAEVYRAAGGEGPDAEVARLREELDKLNTGRQKLQEEHDEYARRTDREVYTSLRECEYLRTTLHRVRAWVDRGEPLSAVRGLVAETHLDMAGPRSSLRAGVEADAWCEYWRREWEAKTADWYRLAGELKRAKDENTTALQVLDLVLVDPAAPEDTGEGDDAGQLVDAAETAATRLRLAEAEVVRLATEVERLSAGEVPLIPLELTGGAR